VAENFKPETYSDGSRQRMLAMIQKKVEGQDIIAAAAAEAPKAQIIDLMEALKQSLGGSTGGGAKKAAARKPAKASPRATAKNGKRKKAAR
jgi:DNA end-binding protein Ku